MTIYPCFKVRFRPACIRKEIFCGAYYLHCTGDTFITRRFPREGYQGLEELQAVIGHGSHELRDVELYPGGLILYSLGNFIFQTETVSRQPYEAYDNKRLPIHTKVGAYMDQRSKNGTAGYPTQENVWRSVMASWDMEDGRVTEVRLYPVSLGTGEPRTRRVPRC